MALDDDSFDALLEALAEAPPVPLERLGPGTRLGPYRLDAPLGRGGMGQVFRATDLRLERAVALKVLDPTGGDAQAALREARAAAAVRHPALVTVHDVGESDDGWAYVAMELVEGEPVSSRRVRRRSARAIAVAVAEALAALHEGGLVHRDLKPSNVMVGRDGRVTLVDFGLAAPASEPRRGGTPAFVPPEAADGADIGPTGDIYAFGVLLRWLGSGRVDGLAPPGLRRLAERCTRVDPTRRPQDGSALARAIHRSLRARQVMRWLGVSVALGALVAAAVWSVDAWTVGAPEPPPRAPRETEWVRLTDLDSSAMLFEGVQSPDGHRLAYAERRGVFVKDLRSGEVRRLAEAAVGAHCVAFAGNGTSLWIGGGEGVYRASLGEGEAELELAAAGSGCPVPSPDGRWLAVERSDRLDLLDLETPGSEPTVALAGPLMLVAAAFSPSSDRLAALRVIETEEGAATVELWVGSPGAELWMLHADPAFWMPTHGVSIAWLDDEAILVARDPTGELDGERQLLRTPSDRWDPELVASLPFDSCRLSVDGEGRVAATSHSQEKELLVAPLSRDGIGALERVSRSLAVVRPSGWTETGDAMLVVEQQGQRFRALRHPVDTDALPAPLVDGAATWPMRAGGGVVYWRPAEEAEGEARLHWRDPEGVDHLVARASEPGPGARGWRRPPPVRHWVECDPDAPRCVLLRTGDDASLQLIGLPDGETLRRFEPPESAVASFAARWGDSPAVAIPIRGEGAIEQLDLGTGERVRRVLPEGCDGHQLTFAPDASDVLIVAGWCRPPEPYRVMRVSAEGTRELHRSAERLLGDPRVSPDGTGLALHGHTFRSNVWRLSASP